MYSYWSFDKINQRWVKRTFVTHAAMLREIAFCRLMGWCVATEKKKN